MTRKTSGRPWGSESMLSVPIRVIQSYRIPKIGLLRHQWLSSRMLQCNMSKRAYYMLNPNDEAARRSITPHTRRSIWDLPIASSRQCPRKESVHSGTDSSPSGLVLHPPLPFNSSPSKHSTTSSASKASNLARMLQDGRQMWKKIY